MGTDIHLWVEARDNEHSPWRLIVLAHPLPKSHQCHQYDQCPWCDGNREHQKSLPRDYSMFALLAGVRAREQRPKPISEPRGWPDDLSEGLRAHLAACAFSSNEFPSNEFHYNPALLAWPGDHDDSWVTLREIIERVRLDVDYPGYRTLFLACFDWGTPENVRLIFNFDS